MHKLCSLVQNFPEFEVALDAGQVERFQEIAMLESTNNPDKFIYKPRVLIEVYYTMDKFREGVIRRDQMVRQTVSEQLDPECLCQ